MLIRPLILLLYFTVAQHACAQIKTIIEAPVGARENINLQWRYHKGAVVHMPGTKHWQTSSWSTVNLPHSYSLTSINLDDSDDDKSQRTFHRDVSYYERTLLIEGEKGSHIFLEFEGAHQRTRLWVNGKYVGEHAISAYTPFHFDITEFAVLGKTNTIALELDNRLDATIPPDGHTADYILFGGLYRDVYLNVLPPVHFSFDWESTTSGIFITTPTVSPKNATVSVRSEVVNRSEQSARITLQTLILDAQGKVIAKKRTQHDIANGVSRLVRHTTGIDKEVRLWSPDHPYLYTVVSQILDNKGRLLHSRRNPLGLRTFELEFGKGLLLNGEPIEIIGANRHQHFPYIGDAVPNNLHRMDAIKFKASGMNLVRLAHYPHDNAFLDACDELGLIVVEEPPTWIGIGDEAWMDNLDRAARRMIRNHRNHPSVLGWGAGINHRGTIKRLHYAAKEEDPTRITMNNGTLWTGEQHSGITDLYAVMDYRGAKRPADDLLFAMEHTGSGDSVTLQEIVSRYKGDPNLIGLASWSAHDSHSFIKRDEQYPNLSVWQASSWDAFRLPKPNFFWYQSELTQSPMVHIPDERGQFEDKVQLFTNAQEVEVFHNDESLGRFKAQRDDANQHLSSPSIFVPFKWTSGTLRAHALENGEVVARHERRKGHEASQLKVFFDTDGFDGQADGSSIIMAYAQVTDADGFLVDGNTPSVSFSLKGDGKIVGDKKIGANPVAWRNGHAPIMVRVGTSSSMLTLTAHANGLKSDTATLTLTEAPATQSPHANYVIFDPLVLSADMGNAEQHPQEGFYIWSHNEGDDERRITSLNDESVSVAISSNKALSWDSTWGVPGDLSFLIEDGVKSAPQASISLTFRGLAQGNYTLKTWHHMLSDDINVISPIDFSLTGVNPSHSPKDYMPTYGKRIAITEAGGGERGDGGSNKGAAGYALHQFTIDKHGEATLTMRAEDGNKPVRLNGFELVQQFNGATR